MDKSHNYQNTDPEAFAGESVSRRLLVIALGSFFWVALVFIAKAFVSETHFSVGDFTHSALNENLNYTILIALAWQIFLSLPKIAQCIIIKGGIKTTAKIIDEFSPETEMVPNRHKTQMFKAQIKTLEGLKETECLIRSPSPPLTIGDVIVVHYYQKFNWCFPVLAQFPHVDNRLDIIKRNKAGFILSGILLLLVLLLVLMLTISGDWRNL